MFLQKGRISLLCVQIIKYLPQSPGLALPVKASINAVDILAFTGALA